MYGSLLLASHTTLALLCSSGGAAAPAVQAPEPVTLEHTVSDLPSDPVLAYAWDRGPAVPCVPATEESGASGERRIVYGEAGADEHTRLYETFEGRASEGRFGAGLAVENEESFPYSSPGLFAGSWTLSFWMKLDPAVAGDPTFVMGVDGLFTIEVLDNGGLLARMPTTPKKPAAFVEGVPADEWVHVALAYDQRAFQQYRFVVNGEVRSRQFDSLGAVPDGVLEVGGERKHLDAFRGVIDELRVVGREVDTTALFAQGRATPEPGPHRLRLERASGVEELIVWAGDVDGSMIESESGFRRGELRHVVPAPAGLIRVDGHWERVHAPSPPLPRTTHPTVYLGDHEVFLFGGETRDTHGWGWANTNDTWIFHTDTGTWEEVVGDSAPPPSCHQPAAYSPDHGLVLYPGGWRNDHGGPLQYDSTWVFHVEERRWEELEPTGVKLPPMVNCTLVYHPGVKRFLLFASRERLIYVFNPDKKRWRAVAPRLVATTAGELSPYFIGSSAMAGHDVSRDRIVLFGGGYGQSESKYDDTTSIYDPSTNTLEVLELDRAPEGRVRAAFAYDSKRSRFVLFGGVRDQRSQRYRDLWIFDPEVPAWRPIQASGMPSRRGGYYGMAYDPDLDRFVLLCGRHSKEVFLNEAWLLEVDDEVPGVATYVFDRSEAEGAKRWLVEWAGPEGLQPGLRCRAGDDLVSWGEWSEDPAAVLSGSARYFQVELTLLAQTKGSILAVRRMGFSALDQEPTAGEDVRRTVVELP